MEYVDRTYRKHFSKGRWKGFLISHKETDLWIGVDKTSWQEEILSFAGEYIRQLRAEMDEWITGQPAYAKALIPYPAGAGAPLIFRQMSEAAEKSGIGPMSAVAGAVAQWVGKALKCEFRLKEIVVENGGDIYADICEDMDISVFAGASPLSEKVGLHVEAGYTPLGICTSSGTVGPSLSFGKADAVMIICRDALLADTYATAFANKIQVVEDVNSCIELIREKEDILAAMAIKEDRLGICGQFELKIF